MTGRQMSAEMAEQPDRLRELIARTDEIDAAVRAAAPRPLRGVTLVARGSSDHAAIYGRYLLEYATGKPICLAAPSLHTHYGVRGDYDGQLAIAISRPDAHPRSSRRSDGYVTRARGVWRSRTTARVRSRTRHARCSNSASARNARSRDQDGHRSIRCLRADRRRARRDAVLPARARSGARLDRAGAG
jgi:hypothetical protein